ncbi:MAG: DNA repair protein RadC [Chloroflexi bacterium]|nr:DNA repair protein RadC [Chloroflexota bacterium]
MNKRDNQRQEKKTAGRVLPLQEKFIRSGFDGFADREVIELLLGLTMSARRARGLAVEYLDHFGSLSDFLSASPEELQRASVDPAAIVHIKVLHALPMEVLKQKIVARPVYQSSREIFDYLNYSMRDLKREVLKVIYLDHRNHIIDTTDLSEGNRRSTVVDPREVVDNAMKRDVSAMILVHNHPSGDPTASRSDKQQTRDMVYVGMILKIKVLDHIIIGGDGYFSFADAGLIEKYEDSFLNLRIRAVAMVSEDRSAYGVACQFNACNCQPC